MGRADFAHQLLLAPSNLRRNLWRHWFSKVASKISLGFLPWKKLHQKCLKNNFKLALMAFDINQANEISTFKKTRLKWSYSNKCNLNKNPYWHQIHSSPQDHNRRQHCWSRHYRNRHQPMHHHYNLKSKCNEDMLNFVAKKMKIKTL